MNKIKRLFTLIIILNSFIQLSFSQYESLISEKKLWVELNSFSDVTDPRPPEKYFDFKYFKGDTIIHNLKYFKLFRQRFHLDTWYTDDASHLIDSTLNKPIFTTLMREDTVEKTVYVLDPGINNAEEILYDFSITPGDTINFLPEQKVLDSISFIKLKNGKIVKQFNFHDNKFSEIGNYYIESIGGVNGLLNPLYFIPISGVDGGSQIICYSIDSTELFGSCNYPEYVASQLINREDNNPEYILFPNPCQEYIIIDLGRRYSKVNIKIYNLQGAIILKEHYLNQRICRFENLRIDKGIYIVSISTDKKQKEMKLIKK